MSDNADVVVGIVALGVIGMLILGLFVGYPIYNVWQKEKSGQAELAKAEWDRQIQVQEAKAFEESANYLADAEVIRAHGVAEANQIIGDSLKDNDAYLRYLWIQNLDRGNSEIVYVPTEAQIPIMEAGRTVRAVSSL